MSPDHLRRSASREFELDCACDVFPPPAIHRDSRLVEAGEPNQQVESITGHLSRRMLEHHSHIGRNAKKGALARLDAASKPAAGEAPQPAVTAGRRGHGISWPEQIRSWSKSLDREFFGQKRTTQSFADAMYGWTEYCHLVKLAACRCQGLPLCKGGLDIRPGRLICITGIVDMTTPTRAPAHMTFSTADLAARTNHRRAVEALIWGIPAVNFDLMYQSHVRDAKGAINQVWYWSRIPNWKNQTLTPNPDTIYLMPFFSTKDVGAVVLEIPPADEGSITGTIMDCWQGSLEDVGPAGVDKGKGGST